MYCQNSRKSSVLDFKAIEKNFISKRIYKLSSKKATGHEGISAKIKKSSAHGKTPKALKVFNINCQSVLNKRAELYALLDYHDPDIVIGTESWLSAKKKDSEFFPKSRSYIPFWQDRTSDTQGGGVLILVQDNLIATEQRQLKSNKKKLNMKHHVQMGRVPTITENKIQPIILISLSLSQIDQLWQYPFIADICIWNADNCIRNINL